MHAMDAVAPSRDALITFTSTWNARTFLVRAPSLSGSERSHLQAILDQLAGLGTIVLGRSETLPEYGDTFEAVIDVLRQHLGRLVVDAAIGAACHPATPFVPPLAVIPLWDFEPAEETADILVADGLLLGQHLMIEALRVEDDDQPMPIPACRPFWEREFGAENDLGTVRIPGGTGAYAVRAVVKAA